MIRPILDALRGLQRELNIHYAVTCLLAVKATSEDGEITSSEPKLLGFDVPLLLLAQFPDQIIIGRMSNPEGVVKPRLQFNALCTKTIKEKSGEVKKFTVFHPRLRGVKELPPTMAADFKEILKRKEAKV